MSATVGNARKQPVLVVLQLSGGNDFLNTVIPYGDGLYYELRKGTGIPQEAVLRIDNQRGFHPAMGPFQSLWDEGKVAVIQGIGYPKPDRSHFRSMDIWHTAEPAKASTEGWLGKTIRELDPRQENVCTGVSFGIGLPRAMYLPDTPVMAVTQLESTGMLRAVAGEKQRRVIAALRRYYAPEEVGEAAMIFDHIGQTGRYAMAGADVLRQAPASYSSSVQYDDSPLAQSLKGIAQVHLAGIGTRIFYAQQDGFDVHTNEAAMQQTLWTTVSRAVRSFFQDLCEHGAADEVVMLIFSEFGRRAHDNGNGTDHGAGGGAFLIGERVNGGWYGEYPSLEHLVNQDLGLTTDFRSLYASVLEQWLGVNPVSIANGTFEQYPQIVAPLPA